MTGTASRIGARQGPWPGALSVVGLAAAGLACGVAAKIGDEASVRWATDLGSYPGAWVLTLAMIGWCASTAARAALLSAAFFAAMTLSYYGWASEVLGFTWEAYSYAWLAASVTVVPLFAAGTWWATRRSGALPGAVMALMAGLVMADGTVHQLWLEAAGHLPDGTPLHVTQAVTNLVVLVALVAFLPRRMATRAWAVVLVVPMVSIAERLSDIALRMLS